MKSLLWIYRSWNVTTGIIAVEENEQVRHHNPFAHLFLRSPLKCQRLSSCRDTSFECCWLDGILPVESHLMLPKVILLPRLVLFISIHRPWLPPLPFFSSFLSSSHVCFILSEVKISLFKPDLSRRGTGGDYWVFGLCTVAVVFLSVHWDFVVYSVRQELWIGWLSLQ